MFVFCTTDRRSSACRATSEPPDKKARFHSFGGLDAVRPGGDPRIPQLEFSSKAFEGVCLALWQSRRSSEGARTGSASQSTSTVHSTGDGHLPSSLRFDTMSQSTRATTALRTSHPSHRWTVRSVSAGRYISTDVNEFESGGHRRLCAFLSRRVGAPVNPTIVPRRVWTHSSIRSRCMTHDGAPL